MMGATSNEAKQRWKDGNYTQVNVSLPPETVTAFKAKCSAAGVSMRSEISKFMDGGVPAPISVKTRRDRRKAVKAMIRRLEAVIAAETGYAENIPENLQGSVFHEAAEDTVSELEEALAILSEAY